MDKNTAIVSFSKFFFGSEDPQLISTLAQISKLVEIKAKEKLFNEEDEARYMYYVISGEIKLFRVSNDGKEIVIKFASADEIFAEATITHITTYPVSASALNDSKLLAINVKKLRSFAYENPEFMMKLLGIMTRQLKYMVDTISSLVGDNTTERLIKYLKIMSSKSTEPTFTLPVSKSDLALLLGTTPETVSRLFTKLKNDGIIIENGKNIELIQQ